MLLQKLKIYATKIEGHKTFVLNNEEQQICEKSLVGRVGLFMSYNNCKTACKKSSRSFG